MILNDTDIKLLMQRGCIEHGIDHKVRDVTFNGNTFRVPSYGLEPAGYTFRLGMDILIPTGTFMSNVEIPMEIFDFDGKPLPQSKPNRFKRLDALKLIDPTQDIALYKIDPGQFFLGSSIEYFRVPTNMIARFVPKSTNERIGFEMNTMTGEPGWEGTITVEMRNTTQYPLYLYTGVGCMQVHFEQLTGVAENPYDGAYQQQVGITLAAL